MNLLVVLPLIVFIDCGSNQDNLSDIPDIDDTISLLFTNVSQTHLPVNILGGLSMDAGVADIDGDSDLDIIIANEHRPNIILINDGSGKFKDESSTRIPQVDHDSEDVAIADFDGDGDLDIFIVSEDDQVNELYLNDGNGFFKDAGHRIPVTGTSNSCLASDINNDGYIDLLIGNNGQNYLLMNDGKANFTDEGTSRLGTFEDVTQDMELGDVDGDGDLDLIIGNEDRNRLLINKGNGFFEDRSQDQLVFRPENEETREADFGDVDGDGDLDILFANVEAFVEGALRQNRLLINDGNGFYKDASSQIPIDQDRSLDGDFFDLDNDGDIDILTSNINGDQFGGETPYRVYLNNGSGSFVEVTESIFPIGTVGRGLDTEYADFNGDGKKDLFLCSRGSEDILLFAK